VRLCLSIEIQEGVPYSTALALTQTAESLGFDASLLAEHYEPSGLRDRYAGGYAAHISADAWVYLAALASETSRIRLGTLVSPVTLRHPSVLAKMAATLDHVSGGRSELGMGAGWLESEHHAYGFDFPTGKERVDLLEEQLQIITGLWRHDVFSHAGPTYQLTEARFTPRPARKVPILIGARADSRRLLRLAAQFADELVISMATLEQCREVRGRLDTACERVGREPSAVRLAMFTPLCVADTEGEAAQLFESITEREPIFARMAPERANWVMGSPAQVAERIAALEAAGVQRLMLSVTGEVHQRMLPLLRGEW
jgi:alkanesulfonate monooxygenase SsuD/methylene tetrahydromethanopterin reductase-like flavin-dependent oxidoreductase (luciferase family)